MENPIKVVFFDVGGVLCSNCDWYYTWGKWFDPSLAEVVEEARKDEWAKIREDEDYPIEQFWTNILKAGQVDPNLHKWVDDLIQSQFKPFFFTIALADRLSQRGVTIGIISNHIKTWFTKLIEGFKIRSVFKDPNLVLGSCFVKCSKPSHDIFDLAFKRAQAIHPDLVPANVLVVDDQQKNIDSAKKYGFQVLLFDSEVNSQYFLVEKLQALGVDASEHN